MKVNVNSWLRKYIGLVLGLTSFFLFKIFQLFPTFLEAIYTNGVYKFIRWIYSFTLTYIPFPLLYAFIFLIFYLLIRFFTKKQRLKRLLPSVFNFAGILVFVFYWSWGFNYAREDFAIRVDLEVTKPNLEFLYTELLTVDSIILDIRRQMQSIDSIPLSETLLQNNYQDIIRNAQVKLISFFEEPQFKTPRIRELKPNGSLLRIKTAGVYFPFVFEGHIDNGLHHIEKPYVMAHEMAHAHAFTDEGVCNFIGFITCVNAEDLFVQYSGWLEYQGYLFRALRRNFPEDLKERDYHLPQAVITDLNSIRERLKKYPSIAPQIRDLFYNNYLKAQGVHAGMKSYAQITRLAYSYKQEKGSFLMK